jgi:hypothetical protein
MYEEAFSLPQDHDRSFDSAYSQPQAPMRMSARTRATQEGETLAPLPPELKLQIKRLSGDCANDATSPVHNERLRDPGQSFADAMCEGSIVEGLDNGPEILGMIRNAGFAR